MNEQTKIVAEHLFQTKLRKYFNFFVKKLKTQKVILYGAAEMLSRMNELCDLSELNIIAICDEKFSKSSNENIKELYGYKTCKIEEIESLNPDYILVSLFNPTPILKYLGKKFPRIKVRPVIRNSFIENIKLLFNAPSIYINYYIPVFLASDDNYAPFVATTAFSILKHTKSQIQFFIIDDGISLENKKLIQISLKKFDNYTIEFIPFPDFPGHSNILKHSYYNKIAFARFLIPNLKPNLIKAIYLDVDIIVRSDITKLFMQSLDNYAIGAVPEDFQPYPYPGIGMLKKDCPEYKYLSDYFNDGVLLIDVQEFIRNNYTEKLIETTAKYIDIAPFADQCILNILFENNYKKLDYSMNYMPMLSKFYKNHLQKDFRKIQHNAMIYHYTNQYCLEAPLFSRDFWNIAKKLPFYKELKSRANKIFLDKIKTLFKIG